MISEIRFSNEKIRSERSDSIALAVDVSGSLMTAVYYDLQLKRRFARASLFGTELKPDNARELLIKLVTSSMRANSVGSADVKSVGIAASFQVSGTLEGELSPSDLFLRPETEIYYVPFISAAIGGRFTASLLTLPEGDCLSADFGKTLCVAERRGDQIRCASFPLAGAFDGSGFESGMPPEKGAIDFVRCESDGTLVYEVVGDCDSIGVSPCGAAASVAIMLDKCAVDSDGIMIDRDLFAIGEDFFVSQNDVRVFQSDKSSGAAALGLFPEARRAFLSGEIFASEKGLRLMTELGVIPKPLAAAFCRNSTEQGIIMCLENKDARAKAKLIAEKSLDITYELLPKFDKSYYEHLILEKKCEN